MPNHARSSLRRLVNTFVVTLPLLMGTWHLAIAVDYDPNAEKVNVDAFAESMYWSALGVLEAERLKQGPRALDRSASLRLQGCALLLMSAFNDSVFQNGESDIDRLLFQRRTTAFLTNRQAVQKHRAVCKADLLNSDAYVEIMTQSLTKPRPLTQLAEIQATPELLRQRALKFDALGILVQGVLLVRRNGADMNPVHVDIRELEPKEKVSLFSKCGSAYAPCSIRIEGEIDSGSGGYFIRAGLLDKFVANLKVSLPGIMHGWGRSDWRPWPAAGSPKRNGDAHGCRTSASVQ